MSPLRTLFSLLLALGCAWGIALSLLTAMGAKPAPWAAAAIDPASPEAPCDCEPGEPPLKSNTTPAAAESDREASLTRYSVCGRQEAPPALAELPGITRAAALFALHCGNSVHLIGVEDDTAAFRPRRLAELSVSSESPAESTRAVPPASADLDGDGLSDLLVPFLLVDAQGSPRGGALERLRARAEGGFEPPVHVIDFAAGAVVSANLDQEPGADLALLQLGDAQVQRASELWTLRGGPAPRRSATKPLPLGPAALAAVDLDRDGLDDVAVASSGANRVALYRGGKLDVDPDLWELPAVREAFAADLDGDGANDLVLIGASVWLVRADKSAPLVPRELIAADALRDVRALDTNADGKLDLVGYAHPELLALVQREPLRFERSTLASVRGSAAVLFVRVADLGGSAAPDAWITTVSSGAEPTIDIALARDLGAAVQLRIADATAPLADVPLLGRFSLR